jgi:hypothetical protein
MEMELELEQLFIPTQRLQAIWEEVHDDPFHYAEVELLVLAEEFLDFHWDWDDLGLDRCSAQISVAHR